MQVSAVNDGGKGKKGKNKMTRRQRERAKARTRASTRAVTPARIRNETVGTVVNGKYISKVIGHIARSGDTNAQIVGTRMAQQKTGAVAGIQEPEAGG